MNTSVNVDVPKDAEWAAEVTTVERNRDGQIRTVWADTVKAGDNRYFWAQEGVAIVVVEKEAARVDDLAGMVGVFAFALNQPVSLVGTDERGTVIARAEYVESSASYLIRYRAGDGRLTEAWWNEAAITAIGVAQGDRPTGTASA